MKTETAPVALRLDLNRTIDAPVARVFAAWTDVKQFAAWLGCPDSKKTVEGDIRVGGTCRFHGEGQKGPFAVNIVYKEIVSNERIVFTWTAEGSCCGMDGETIVTVNFRPVGQKTEIRLAHEGFLTDESQQGHSYGWNMSFDTLAKTVA